MVVAETCEQAQTAAENVVIDYEVLPWVADTTEAAQAGAPRVWEELPDNILVDSTFGDVAATDAAFARARHVVSTTHYIGRVTGVPLEPRAALGSYDAETGRYTVYAGSGGAVRQKQELAHVLGVKPRTCACCRSTSAATSERATAPMSSSVSSCGPRAKSADP